MLYCDVIECVALNCDESGILFLSFLATRTEQKGINKVRASNVKFLKCSFKRQVCWIKGSSTKCQIKHFSIKHKN